MTMAGNSKVHNLNAIAGVRYKIMIGSHILDRKFVATMT